MFGILLSFVRSQVDNLLQNATKEVDRLQDEVLSGLRNAMNPLSGGGWTGQAPRSSTMRWRVWCSRRSCRS